MLNWLRSTPTVLDLDDPGVSEDELERTEDGADADAWTHTPATRRKFLEIFLKWALESHATAAHFMHDVEDEVVRELIYVPRSTDPTNSHWVEAVPTFESFADRGFLQLRRIAKVKRRSREGSVTCRYGGREIEARCACPSETDFVVYFTDDRPAIKHRGDPLD